MSCQFCELEEIKNRIIVQNKFAFAFLSNMPIVPGHILVVSNRCVSKFDEMTKEEIDDVFDLMTKLKQSLRQTFGAEGFNHAWNEGLTAGQTVPHFHLHLVPRKEDDRGIVEYEPRKFLYRPGVRTVSKGEELQEVTRLIKENL